jgi:hypothetical protein
MKYAKLRELPLSSIQPEGWLRRYLEVQRDGLTGHLEVAGYPFDGPGWGGAEIKGHQGSHWWPYEQTGYWIDGMIRCGRLLGDRFLIDKAKHHIDYVLDHADADGYLGPKFMRKSGPGVDNNRWPHAVFFRAMMTEYSATGDARIPKALAKHYLSPGCDHAFARDVCNVEPMVWAYEKTGDKRLLQLAVEAFEGHNKLHPDAQACVRALLSPERATEHGVTYNEIGKLGAVLYLHTGNRKFLRATINGYKKIDRDHTLIDGVCSSTEGLAGKDALASHETCDIAEHPWGLGYLLMATGDARYADQIEKAVFNAAPGAVKSDDFKALQYFSCPNQVVADDTSNHNFYFRGSNWMAYRPNPPVQCCPGEVNRIMPNYAGRMWMSDGRGGIVAALYGPSVLNTRIDGQDVAIVQETQYPFSEHIDFTIRTAGEGVARRPSATEGTHPPVKFALHVRIPAWCKRAQISVNGRRLARKFAPGTFVKIARTFAHNDRVSLLLPMEIEVSHWPDGGIGITRGPLVYALRIEEDWQDASDPKLPPAFPAWKVYPKSDWNYALCVNEKNANEVIEVVHRPAPSNPWSVAAAPIELRVPARKVAGWKMLRTRQVFRHDNVTFPGKGDVEFNHKGDFRLTPPLPEPKSLPGRLAKKVETVTLIPYGCTHLRIAIFPQAR